jgi:hypothetical protein
MKSFLKDVRAFFRLKPKKSLITQDDAFFNALRQKVIVWESLERDWDGDDGVPPPVVVRNNTKEFIEAMRINKVPHPTIYIAGDGEIGFRWKLGALTASVSFLSDGYVVGYCPGRVYKDSIDFDFIYARHRQNPVISTFFDALKTHSSLNRTPA